MIVVSTLVTTTVSSAINTSISLYNSCRDELQKDRQAFFRVSTELWMRSNYAALELGGQSLPKKTHFSDSDTEMYARYFTQDSPYILKEFQGRSFSDLEFEAHDIIQKWYTPYFMDIHSSFAIHPLMDKMENARFMFVTLQKYNTDRDPRLLDFAIEDAKKYLSAVQSWSPSPNTFLDVRELGGECPRWAGPDTLKLKFDTHGRWTTRP